MYPILDTRVYIKKVLIEEELLFDKCEWGINVK